MPSARDVLCLVIPMFLACSAEPVHQEILQPPQVSKNVVKLFGGEQAVEIIQNADTVNAYRQPQKSYHQRLLSDYEILSGPVPVAETEQQQLLIALLANDSYMWEVAKGCAPDYGVRIEFSKGGDKVNVLFCFGCSQLQVYRNGKSVKGEEFDPIEKKLIEITKRIFPDDKAIQALDESEAAPK